MKQTEITHISSVSIVSSVYILHIPVEANERNNMKSIARQRHNKYASLTIKSVLSVWSVPKGYKTTQSEDGTK
jgi:hypothetical protein